MRTKLPNIALAACALAFLPVIALSGCAQESAADSSQTSVFGQSDNTLRVAAGMKELTPSESTEVLASIDLARLGLTNVDAVYEVSTPAGEEFSLSLATRREGNAGEARISVAHASIAGAAPNVGVESLVDEGMLINGVGQTYRNDWLDVTGDGFARVTISGEIDKDQVIVGTVNRPDGSQENVVIVITIGDESEINLPDTGATPGVTKSERTIYSSDSWLFGLPAIAVSGDRYSVAAYDGNRDDVNDYTRKRVWLQYNESSADVTGGESAAAGADSGFWRDQEITSRANVLAVAYTGAGEVRCEVSLDRGASFPIEHVIESNASTWGSSRLVQCAIAEDYTLGVLYWRSVQSASGAQSELVLAEAYPSGFNEFNTPDGYNWSDVRVVHAPGMDVTPLVMELEYAEDGVPVIGYGYTSWELVEGTPMSRSRASFRCAVGNPDEIFRDVEVDFEENIMPCDPSISLIGSGSDMQIFYAFEKTDGVYVAYSVDAGMSFIEIGKAGSPGAMAPSIHARDQDGALRLDVIYLEPTGLGLELHGLHWDDFATAPMTSEVRTYTQTERIDIPGGGMATPGAPNFAPYSDFMIRSVPWFGFDAVDNGDDIAVVVHEQVQYAYSFMGMGFPGQGIFLDAAGGLPTPAAGAGAGAPAILLPGMGEPVDAPNPDHASQLKIIVID